MLEPAI